MTSDSDQTEKAHVIETPSHNFTLYRSEKMGACSFPPPTEEIVLEGDAYDVKKDLKFLMRAIVRAHMASKNYLNKNEGE